MQLKNQNKINFFAVLLGLILLLFPFSPTKAVSAGYPKLANYFLQWHLTAEDAKELAKWDFLILDMEVQVNNRENLRKIREYNPDIKIVAYITSQEIRQDAYLLPSNSLRKKLYKRISDDWWLRDVSNNFLSWWPSGWLLNVTDKANPINSKRWNDILPEFVQQEIMAAGLWDGVFYDNVWETLSWYQQPIDLDGDGEPESARELNNQWWLGMAKILQRTRSLIGAEKLIVSNGGTSFYPYLNGVLFEHFPQTKEGDWSQSMQKYFFVSNKAQPPRFNVLNANTANTGKRDDFRKMRFGLMSALLNDGYYSFDFGDIDHSQLWWYDEYNVFLGQPLGAAYDFLNKTTKIWPSLWRRDFQNGVVLVNSRSEAQNLDFGQEEYEKIRGSQDKQINSGSIISKLILGPNDGIVLLRTLEKLTGAAFTNGAFARILDASGDIKRSGFFVYEEWASGGSQVMLTDVNGNDKLDLIRASKGKVDVLDHRGHLLQSFYPFGEKFRDELRFAVGDLDQNGTLEIVVSQAKKGGGVKIFNLLKAKLLSPAFYPFGKNWQSGINVAVGNLDGQGQWEIVAAAGAGAEPEVKVFDYKGKLRHSGFFAYLKRFRGGVNVAAGDLDGDGKAEIITGAGVGGGPHIRIFDGNGQARGGFFAFDKTSRQGVNVATQDLDSDGKAEIIGLTM